MFASGPANDFHAACRGHTGSQKRRSGCQGSRKSNRTQARAQKDKPDLIERMFGGLFGKGALDSRAPLGMKRMSEQALAEQSPAVLELTEPLKGDSTEETRLERAALRLAYDANEQGWTAAAFHLAVDGFGAAVVLARTAGAIFGGFNPRGWIGLGEDRNSMSAFLFTWPDSNTAKPAYKLRKVGGAALAVLDDPNKGPRFGAEGLTINLESFPGRERLARFERKRKKGVNCLHEGVKAPQGGVIHNRSRLGAYYERRPDGGRHLFSDNENPKGEPLTDLKVFVAEGRGETWQLDGIVWKTGTADDPNEEQ